MQREGDNLSESGDMSESEASAWASVILDIYERLKAKEAKDHELESEAA